MEPPEIEEFLRRLSQKKGGKGKEDIQRKYIGEEILVKLLLESKVRNAEKEEREKKGVLEN